MTRPRPRLLVASGAFVALLAACAVPGGGDAGEGCRNQVTSFNGSGDAFLAPAGRWADPGQMPRGTVATDFSRSAAAAPGAGLDSTLRQENADLDALQIAFDALLYCRWIEARTIRAEFAANRVPRQAAETRMAALRARLQRDLARAQSVLDALEARTRQRDVALEAAAPGSREAARRARAETGATRSVVAAATVTLRLRPEAGAPEIGRVAAGQAVSVRPAQSGFALVEGQGGLRGYAPTGAFQIAERAAPSAAGPASGIRQLVATNIARRDNFAESLGLAREAAVSGFELGA
ncbi:hypothetical protein AAFN86_10040 [Roseomonas sp. CAU 1739]|uniref:hypothetical protein n=1 Tax=Roseomonas sp. CAU 1739 TaxID=3140364 RepID=UPI00325BAC58